MARKKRRSSGKHHPLTRKQYATALRKAVYTLTHARKKRRKSRSRRSR